MKFPTIIKECESELLSKPIKPLLCVDKEDIEIGTKEYFYLIDQLR